MARGPTAAPADLDGRPVLRGGRYVVFGKIAEGGMAGVYRAWDTQLRGWRAIKVLAADFANRKKLRTRFESEARAMAAIDHPNVVRVFDVVSDVPLPYLVMEVADGGSLQDWVDRHGAMPPRLAVRCTLEVAAGLAAAHALGIIHRDVKPQNVLLDRDGRCLVSDFGIARVDFGEQNQLTRTGTSMGTIGYMAPEQRSDAKVVDQRADVYATGALLFKLLTSVVLTDMFMIGHDPELIEPVPPPLRPALVAACAHDRNKRPADLPAFAALLRDVLDQLPEDPPGLPALARESVPEDDDDPSAFSAISVLLVAGPRALHDSTVPMLRSNPGAQATLPAETHAPTFSATALGEPTAVEGSAPGAVRPATPVAAELRTLPPALPPPSAARRAARIVLGVGLLGAASGAGCGGLGVATVRSAYARDLAARSALYQQIAADQGLVDLVVARSDDGAGSAELLARQGRWQSAVAEPEKQEAADAFATLLLAQTQPLLLSGSLGTADVQATNLARTHAEWREAREGWRATRENPPTSWLVPLVVRAR